MRSVAVRDLQRKVKECVDLAQRGRVVITRRGKPAAVLVGVEGKDWEQVTLETSAAFWKLVEARRQQPTIPLGEMKARLRKRKP